MLNWARRIYLFLLVFTPLAFGTVQQWSKGVMEGLVFAALLLFLIDLLISKRPFYRVPGTWAVLAFPAFALFQLVPLPAFLVRLLSPETYGLYAAGIGLVEPVNWVPLSVNPREGLLEFFRYSAYAAFFVLSVQLLSDKAFLKKAVNTVVVFASALAFVAILQHFTAGNRIFWFQETHRGSPFGPYVNRNHFAGLAGMLFPVLLTMFLFNKPRVSYSGWRTKIAEFFSYPSANTYLLHAAGLLLLGAATFLSLSRGGIVSLCLAVCLFGLLVAARGADRGRGLMLTGLFALVLFSVGWFGWDPIFKRFGSLRDPAGEITDARLPLWKDSLQVAGDFPVAGTGFGTFVDIYPGYRTVSGGGIYSHAHNDYLELAVEGGAVGVGLAGWFLYFILRTWRQFTRRRDSLAIYLYMGALAGLASILVHSVTDFNLHIGANGLYFFFICSLCVAAAHTRIRGSSRPSYLKPADPGWVKLSLAPAGIFLVSSLVLNTGAFVAEANFEKMLVVFQKEKLEASDQETIRSRSLAVLRLDPLNSLFYSLFSHAEKELGNEEAAFEAYKKAVILAPAKGVYLQTMAETVSDRGDKATAEALYRSAVRRDVKSALPAANYAFWLMKNGQKEKGISTLQEAISLSPLQTRRYLEILVDEKLLEESALASVLPERVLPRILYAEYLAEKGDSGAAEAAYAGALAYLDREPEMKPDFFFKVYTYYLKQNRLEAALEVMRKGTELLPENARIRVAAAGLYEKLGISYRAVEEYEKTLVLDPKNRQARKRLALLRQ